MRNGEILHNLDGGREKRLYGGCRSLDVMGLKIEGEGRRRRIAR